jgi:hypothetical protein
MERLPTRFDQSGGLYDYKFETKDNQNQQGGKVKKDLSVTNEKWKKKYLETKIERDDLKKENEKLKKEIQKIKNK